MSKLSEAKRMRKLVSEYHISGQSQKAFAQSRGLTKGKLHYWVKKLSKESNNISEASCSFIPIEVGDSEVSTSRFILIHLPNGLEIQIPV